MENEEGKTPRCPKKTKKMPPLRAVGVEKRLYFKRTREQRDSENDREGCKTIEEGKRYQEKVYERDRSDRETEKTLLRQIEKSKMSKTEMTR